MSNIVVKLKGNSKYLGGLLKSAETNTAGKVINFTLFVSDSEEGPETQIMQTIDVESQTVTNLDLNIAYRYSSGLNEKSEHLKSFFGENGRDGLYVVVPATANFWKIKHDCAICCSSSSEGVAESGKIER